MLDRAHALMTSLSAFTSSDDHIVALVPTGLLAQQLPPILADIGYR